MPVFGRAGKIRALALRSFKQPQNSGKGPLLSL
jgi:hypothetical protein